MKGTESICSRCRQIKSVKEFSNGYGAQASKKVHLCKECCSYKLDKYKEYVGEEGAFWLLCAELGIPYIQGIYELSLIHI